VALAAHHPDGEPWGLQEAADLEQGETQYNMSFLGKGVGASAVQPKAELNSQEALLCGAPRSQASPLPFPHAHAPPMFLGMPSLFLSYQVCSCLSPGLWQ
jgi:hypothetical protein